MEKIYIKQKEELTYVSEITEDEISLRYTDSDIWTPSTSGEHIGSIIDDGNGIEIKMGDVELSLDYDKFHMLYTLMEVKMNKDENLAHKNEYLKLEE